MKLIKQSNDERNERGVLMHQEQQKANFDVQSSSQDSCDFEHTLRGTKFGVSISTARVR
jgi:hypothetical protein